MRVFQLVFCLALAICLTVGCSRKTNIATAKGSQVVDPGNPNYNADGTVVSNGVLYLSDGQGPSFNAIPTGLAQPVTHNFILTNRSAGNADGINISLTGTDFGIEHRDCQTTLAAGASCTISIGFRPSQVGNYSAVLKIEQTNGAPVERQLVGTGVVPPLGHLTFENAPDPGVFGATFPGAGITHPFYVRNDGNGPLTQFEIGMPVDNTMMPSPFFQLMPVTAMPGDSGTPICSSLRTLAAGQRCGFVVQFIPQVPSGTLSALQYGAAIPIRFVDNAYRQIAWLVRGASSLPPVLDMVDTAPAPFANVEQGGSAAVCLTVRNTHASLPATQVQPVPALPAPFSIDNSITCANTKCIALAENTLGPNAQCDIPVRFSPAAGAGRNASIVVSVGYHNGISAQTESATVSATSMNNCTFNLLKQVFNNGATWIGVFSQASGSTIFNLPADAKNISAKMTRIDVDDYGATVSVNGASIYDNSAEFFKVAHSTTVNVPFLLHEGANVISGSAKDYIWEPTSLSIQIEGAYQTAGACNAN